METKEHSKIQKLMKSKPAKAGVSVALVGTLALAGIGAYFTGTDTVENKFDISAGLTDKITVVEENWDTTDADDNGIPDAAEHVVPLQTLAKDPVVKNETDVEAWLFCQIKVPTANVSVVGEDGTPEAAASHELFTYTVNEGWTEHGTPVVADGYTTHTYLYNTKVAANSQTAKAVFDDVTLINLVEAQGAPAPIRSTSSAMASRPRVWTPLLPPGPPTPPRTPNRHRLQHREVRAPTCAPSLT